MKAHFFDKFGNYLQTRQIAGTPPIRYRLPCNDEVLDLQSSDLHFHTVKIINYFRGMLESDRGYKFCVYIESTED